MNAGPSAVHILIDFFGCDPDLLQDFKLLREALAATARESGLTVLNEVFHRFDPHGVSGVLLISESHMSIHTWPEHGYAAVDVFSCNPEISDAEVRASLEAKLRPRKVEVRVVQRGQEKQA